MYLTQSLHRELQQNPSKVATIFGDRVRTVAESVDASRDSAERCAHWACSRVTASHISA